MNLDTLRRLNEARSRRAASVLITDTGSGEERLILEEDGYVSDPLREELAERFRTGVSGSVTTPDHSFFLTVNVPPPKLVVIGAVHISQALAPMAKIAGFDMTIVDPRTAFATPDRFPEVPVIAEWPDVAIPKVGLDSFTAMAVLTHDPKIDDGALIASLKAGCFYVGALGSRKTHARRLDRLRQAGIEEAALNRIRAPIGIAIGAQTPAEIAVAVLAEIIAALRSRGLEARQAAA
jgi:xanthine dehydrogenase accessory factor